MGLPLRLQLQPSRRMALLLSACYAAFLGGVFICAWPWWLRLLLLLAVLGSWGFQLRQCRQLHGLCWLRLGRKGELVCGMADGEGRAVRLLPGTVWPLLVVLRFQLEKADGGGDGWERSRSLVLMADSVGGEEVFRQLRVWLRWRARFNPDGIF